jgi:hypothetical protein
MNCEFPPAFFAPLAFDPPWDSKPSHWYMNAPGPEYPRLGVQANYGCGYLINPQTLDAVGKGSDSFSEMLKTNPRLCQTLKPAGFLPDWSYPGVTCTWPPSVEKWNAEHFSKSQKEQQVNYSGFAS